MKKKIYLHWPETSERQEYLYQDWHYTQNTILNTILNKKYNTKAPIVRVYPNFCKNNLLVSMAAFRLTDSL